MARKGLPKSIIKKYGISKKAWAVYRGKKKSRSSKMTRKSNPKRRVRRIPRRRKRSRRGRGLTIPLAPIAGLAAGMAQPVDYALKGEFMNALDKLAYHYAGVSGVNVGNPKFDTTGLFNGLVPLVIGVLVHKFVGGPPLNLNQMLARANVPFIRI